MTTSAAAIIAVSFLLSMGSAEAQNTPDSRARVPIVGLPCEGCEAVFEGLPDTLTNVARIAPEHEPGEPMRIEGTVYDQSGRAASGVIVYAYQTDSRGIYPRDERLIGQEAYRHGRLRNWVKTDDRGRYRFDTIRPASYPDTDIPAHVHLHVIEVGCCTYYIDSIHFEDDPYLSREERDSLVRGRGGSGLVRPEKDQSGVWVVTRDIVLGEGIPGYR